MDGPIPWGAIFTVVGALALVVAVRYPRSRRWLAALAALGLFGFAAFVVVMIGAFTTWGRGGGLPLEHVVGSLTLLLVGLALAGWIAFVRRASARVP